MLRKMSAQTLDQWMEPVKEIKDDVARLAILHSHPEWIVSAYFDLLKDFAEVEAALIANNIPAAPTLVWWPGRSSQAELIELGGTPTAFSKYGIKFDGIPNTLEPVRRRRSGVQDEGSQLVAEIFSSVAANSQRWLDLCAGPGGKAALLSSIAQEAGKDFTANELSQPRAELVRQVVGSSRVWVGDGRDIASHGELFDAVLADVPCTGLGALRRRPEVRWRRTVSDLRALTALQRELSDSAISVIADGGLFAYATCSPHFAETSVAVVDILKAHPELEQIDLAEFLPQSINGAIRGKSLSLWTHRHQCDSMFMAVFRKKSE
jgi:16S rRNA (cytosine967-C5)-methyltransferase